MDKEKVSDFVNLAVIGCGKWGINHVRSTI